MGRLRALALVALVALGCKSEGKKPEPAPAPAPETADAAPARGPATLEKPGEVFKTAVRAGRKLVREKKYDEALAMFEKALVLSPESARVHSEVSLAALRAGDLDRAKKAAKLSITLAFDPKLKAASYYNLGAAHEKGGDKKAAIEAYRKSLELRPHDGVEKKLVALGGVPPAKKALQLTRYDGPVAGAKNLCEKDPCFVHEIARAKRAEPFKSAAVVKLSESETPPKGWHFQGNCHVVLETGRGVFIKANGLHCEDVDVTHTLELESVGPGVLAIRYTTYQSSRTSALYEQRLQACGLGRSKVPSCTEPIESGYELITNDDETGDEDRETDDYKIEIKPDAVVVGSGEHRGHHELAFP